MIVTVKVGTSSVTDGEGNVDEAAVGQICDEVSTLRARGHDAVVVTSGAITAGLGPLGIPRPRSSELATLQAVSAVGQSRLMRAYDDLLARKGLVGGQVLLAPLDFVDRRQYLHARQTLSRLLEMGVVPVVNENDAVASDEIRFGDNDRLAALVAHLVAADVLVLLTDTEGLLTADPKVDATASLIEEVAEVDRQLEAVAGGPRGDWSSGGMASKLAAAKMAAWSGVRAVIAAADRPGVLLAAVAGDPGVGTVVKARERRLPARKLWIAFALGSRGKVTVDQGARTALSRDGRSLLPAGVIGAEGDWESDEAVEIAGPDGAVFAKGLAQHDRSTVLEWAGRRSNELPADVSHEVVHRDDLVLLAGARDLPSDAG